MPRIRLALAALAVALTAAPAAADSPQWRALVIGIDAYRAVPPLNGAVNDARDIAATLRQAGVGDLTLITDEAATRKGILDGWQALIDRAGPSDTLVLTYAGHGAQETEWVTGSEADGLDEVFLLAGFSVEAPGNGERLRDDDLAAMLAVAGGRRVLFLADSCHSGTMTRAVDGRVKSLGTRIVGLPELENDVLRAITAETPGAAAVAAEPQSMDNVIYVGATVDGRVIPEMMIGDQPRGALSWAFSRGLEGRADLDRDGAITMEELSRFLSETVRVTTEGRQQPSLSLGAETRAVTLPRVAGDSFETSGGVLTLGATEQSRPVLQLLASRLPDRIEIREGTGADLYWDVDKADIVSRLGDVVADGNAATAAVVSGVAMKWLFLQDLYALAQARQPVEGRLRPAVGNIMEGEQLEVDLEPAEDGHMIVFAVQADGTFTLLAPDRRADPTGKDGIARAGEAYKLRLRAGRPLGADHVVLLHSATPMTGALTFVTALDGRRLEPETLASLNDVLRREVAGVGVVPVYTHAAAE